MRLCALTLVALLLLGLDRWVIAGLLHSMAEYRTEDAHLYGGSRWGPITYGTAIGSILNLFAQVPLCVLGVALTRSRQYGWQAFFTLQLIASIAWFLVARHLGDWNAVIVRLAVLALVMLGMSALIAAAIVARRYPAVKLLLPEHVCPRCHYDRRVSPTRRCPECGCTALPGDDHEEW